MYSLVMQLMRYITNICGLSIKYGLLCVIIGWVPFCTIFVVDNRKTKNDISERQEFLERRLKVNPPLGQIQAAARISDD